MDTLSDNQGRLEDHSLTNRQPVYYRFSKIGVSDHIDVLQSPYEQPCSALTGVPGEKL